MLSSSQPRSCLAAGILFVAQSVSWGAAFAPGDSVVLTRSETLLFNGKNFLGAPKGQEFMVLKVDIAKGTFVSYVKEDGSQVAVTLPTDALQAAPSDGWNDLLHGLECFRELRFEDAKRLIGRAASTPEYRALAGPIATRIVGAINAAGAAKTIDPSRGATARQGFINTAQGLRDLSEQLVKSGYPCLAFAMEEGTDRLGNYVLAGKNAIPDPGALPAGLPPSKTQREDLRDRATTSNLGVIRCRQAVALHRLIAASKWLEEGQKAEPTRPEWKKFQPIVEKGLKDAEDDFAAADRMKRFEKGAVHALTALEHGLKTCADHPKLKALKQEMLALFEARTSPSITPALLAAAGSRASKEALEQGRNLYTKRCTECHELELLDSRSVSAWRDAVASMSRRANLDSAEQAKIVTYLSVAQSAMDPE